jgi:hypothetical protein
MKQRIVLNFNVEEPETLKNVLETASMKKLTNFLLISLKAVRAVKNLFLNNSDTHINGFPNAAGNF